MPERIPTVDNYTPERALDAETTEATQVRYPWRAAIRTGLAVLMGASLILPAVWFIIVDELAKQGWQPSPQAATIAATIIGAVTVAAGIVTRVMAIPAISDILTRINIGPQPKQ